MGRCIPRSSGTIAAPAPRARLDRDGPTRGQRPQSRRPALPSLAAGGRRPLAPSVHDCTVGVLRSTWRRRSTGHSVLFTAQDPPPRNPPQTTPEAHPQGVQMELTTTHQHAFGHSDSRSALLGRPSALHRRLAGVTAVAAVLGVGAFAGTHIARSSDAGSIAGAPSDAPLSARVLAPRSLPGFALNADSATV